MLGNIIDSTRQLINNTDPTNYVSTYAERSALRILNDCGSIFIQGRSGCGKSRLGLRILATASKETNTIPILLTSAKLWNHIPQNPKGKEKYVVMIDDIFGSSNLVEMRVEEWSTRFEVILPSVACGKVSLVLSSRREIASHALRKCKHLQTIQILDLDSDEYSLRRSEKYKLAKKYCSRIPSIREADIKEIAKAEPNLGFPQCCSFFANNKPIHEKGIQFFNKPYEYIATDIQILKENDMLGYYVLLLVVMMDNSLDMKLLSKPSSEFNQIRETLTDVFTDFKSPPSCNKIRDKAKYLFGIYLSENDNFCTFQHHCIFDAVFISAANDSQEIFLRHCPTQILLEFVSLQTSTDILSVHVEKDMYEVLANRLTEIILSDDCWSILSHPAFQCQEFLEVLCCIWTPQILTAVSTHKTAQEDLVQVTCYPRIFEMFSTRFYEVGSFFQEEERIFSFQYAVSCFIMRKIPKLFQLSLPFLEDWSILQEALQCALHMEDSATVKLLLQRNVPFHENFIKIVCCKENAHLRNTDSAFDLLEETGRPLQDPGRLLSLAVQHGNIYIMEKLITKMETAENRDKLFSRCLEQLLFQCNGSLRLPARVSSSAIPIVEMMKLLPRPTNPHIYHDLLRSAASHDSSCALEYLLSTEIPSALTGLDDVLEEAALYGTANNLNLLLRHQTQCQAILLLSAAKSFTESQKKVGIILNKTVHLTAQNLKENTVNVQDGDKNTSLHFAGLRGDAACVNILLKAGADVTMRNSDDLTPIQCAVISGDINCLNEFIQSLTVQEMTDYAMVTPAQLWYDRKYYKSLQRFSYRFLSQSVIDQHRKGVMDVLINSFMDINSTDIDGRTCLFDAAKRRDRMLLAYLLSRGANIVVRDVNGRTALHEAARYADTDTVIYLCEHGAEVGIEDNKGLTAVHEAAGAVDDSVEKLKYLIDAKNAPLTPNKNGRTALFNASETDDTEVLGYLVSKGLDINVIDKAGVNLLHESCWYGSLSFVRYLLKYSTLDIHAQIVLDTRERSGNTALHFAVQSSMLGNSTMVKLLLDHGARVHVKDNKGRTPLHLAANIQASYKFGPFDQRTAREYQDVESRHRAPKAVLKEMEDNVLTMKHLLFKGANANDQDEAGNASLHWALKSVLALHRAKFLVENGANVNQKGEHGRTPLHCTARTHEHACAKYLIKMGSEIDAVDDDGKTAFHVASERGHTMITGILVANGSNVHAQDNNGNTALHLVILSSPRNVSNTVRYLTNVGIARDTINKDGKKAVDLAQGTIRAILGGK